VGTSRFTASDVRAMYHQYDAGIPQTVIAKHFKTHNTAINNILHGRAWRHIHEELMGAVHV